MDGFYSQLRRIQEEVADNARKIAERSNRFRHTRIFARLTEFHPTANSYSWYELAYDSDGVAYQKPNGLSGSMAANPAKPTKNNASVPIPIDVWLYSAGFVPELGGQIWELDVFCRCNGGDGSGCTGGCTVVLPDFACLYAEAIYDIDPGESWGYWLKAYYFIDMKKVGGQLVSYAQSTVNNSCTYDNPFNLTLDLTTYPIIYQPACVYNGLTSFGLVINGPLTGIICWVTREYWTADPSSGGTFVRCVNTLERIFSPSFYAPQIQLLYGDPNSGVDYLNTFDCDPFYAYAYYRTSSVGQSMTYISYITDGACSGQSGSGSGFTGSGSSPGTCSCTIGSTDHIDATFTSATCSCMDGGYMQLVGNGSGAYSGSMFACGGLKLNATMFCNTDGDYQIDIVAEIFGGEFPVFSVVASATTCVPLEIVFTSTMSSLVCGTGESVTITVTQIGI